MKAWLITIKYFCCFAGIFFFASLSWTCKFSNFKEHFKRHLSTLICKVIRGHLSKTSACLGGGWDLSQNADTSDAEKGVRVNWLNADTADTGKKRGGEVRALNIKPIQIATDRTLPESCADSLTEGS